MSILRKLKALAATALLSCAPVFAQATPPPAAQTELSKQGISLKVDILAPTKGVASNVGDVLRDPGYAKTLDNMQQLKRGIWTSNGLGTTSWTTFAPAYGTGTWVDVMAAYDQGVGGANGAVPIRTGGTLYPYGLIVVRDSPVGAFTQTVFQNQDALGNPAAPVGAGGTTVYDAAFNAEWANKDPISHKPRTLAVCAPDFTVLCPSWQPSAVDIAYYASLPTPITVAIQQPYVWNGLVNPFIPANQFVRHNSGLPATPIAAGRSFSGPTVCCVYSGRLIYGGFTQPSGTYNNQNYILISNFLSYNTFSAATPPVATDGGYIAMPLGYGLVTALHPFTTSNGEQILIVGCEHGVAMVTGKDATDFKAVALTDQYGIVSNNTWQTIENELYFLATDGARKLAASDLNFLTPGDNGVLLHDLTNRINTTLAPSAFSVFNPRTRELTLYFAADSDTSCQHAIVFNFAGPDPNSPVSHSEVPILSTRSGLHASCGIYHIGQHLLGKNDTSLTTDDQPILKAYSGNTYEGTPISFTFTSALIPSNSPLQTMQNQKFVILTEGGEQNFTATAYTLTTMADNSTKQLTARTQAFASGTPPSVTDLSTWASGTTDIYPKLYNFDSQGSGRYWCLQLTGTTTDADPGIDLAGFQSIMSLGGWRQ